METNVKIIKTMKTIFILTLGTREVQFKTDDLLQHGFSINEDNKYIEKNRIRIQIYLNNNFPDYLCHDYPREAGETILQHYEMFEPVLCYPLIEKALQQINAVHPIDDFYFVFTNQQDIDVKDKNYHRDTLHYKDIIKRYLQKHYKVEDRLLHDIEITHKAVDYDFQYRQFAQTCRVLFDDKDNIEHIYLLAQGGIDQINHALTLQLIQAFGSKVHLWQQKEGITQADELQFPHLFLKDLLKQQLIALVKEAEYFSAIKILTNLHIDKATHRILSFAHYRKEFIINKARQQCNGFGKNMPQLMEDFQNQRLQANETFINCFDIKNPRIKKALFSSLERLYLADFYFTNKNYSKFVLSFSIFYENLINTYLSSVTGLMIIEKYDKFGNELIQNLCINRPELANDFIRILNRKKSDYALASHLRLSFPALVIISHFYTAEYYHLPMTTLISILEHANFLLNDNKDGQKALDQLRNSIAHDGIGCEEDDLIRASDEAKDISWWHNKIQEIKTTIGIIENPFAQINTLLIDMIKKM